MSKSLSDYLSNNKKKNLIFDFDETIVRLILPWEKSTDRIKDDLINLDSKPLKEYKKSKISFSVLQNTYVRGFGEKALKLFLRNNLLFESEDLIDYLENPNIIDFIKNEKDYNFLIWSSNTKPVINKVLGELEISNKFSKIVSREDVKLLKPYSEGFDRLYSGDSKSNYLFIGDSWSDREAAEKVGIDFYLEEYFNVPGKYW